LNKVFVPDAPAGLLEKPVEDVALWGVEKYQQCRSQIWSVCDQLLVQGINIVLDGAAANKEQRNNSNDSLILALR